MKTNPAARRVVRIRLLMSIAALAAIVALEFYLGASLAARSGQTTARQTDNLSAPSVVISDFMAAAW